MELPGTKRLIFKGLNWLADWVRCLFLRKPWLKNRHFSDADGDKANLGNGLLVLGINPRPS